MSYSFTMSHSHGSSGGSVHGTSTPYVVEDDIELLPLLPPLPEWITCQISKILYSKAQECPANIFASCAGLIFFFTV